MAEEFIFPEVQSGKCMSIAGINMKLYALD